MASCTESSQKNDVIINSHTHTQQAGAHPIEIHLMVSLPVDRLSREVLPTISLPIKLARHNVSNHLGNVNDIDDGQSSLDLGVQNCRGVFVPALGRKILIAESPAQIGKVPTVNEPTTNG